MMRRLLFMLIASFSLISSVPAADSVITITGQLKDNMCTVSVGGDGFTVNLNTYATKNFNSVGNTSGTVPFSITLSNCGSAVSTVKINITGTTDSANATLLKTSTDTGYATGIGVQILDSSQTIVQPNQDSSSLSAITLTANQTNVITYYARMVSTASPVGAGTVSATANFTLQFN
ncbi:fimbrial protein [Rosenbergiella australiborealis]|uniref:fimbrial protein n=1 Tax=Rosenbergiella australiborealis TaxID=1544696 RepID=UPI001F4EC38C|nr:fimbrial protein [Rosenbergiella australiborealis]